MRNHNRFFPHVKTSSSFLGFLCVLNDEFEFRFGGDFTVDEAATDGLADGAAHFDEFRFDDEDVAGDDGAAEFDFVCTHEVADLALVAGDAEHEDGGYLRHGFNLKYAGHDGVFREVALEEELVHGEVFLADALGFSFKADDAVHHEEGVAVRQKFHDFADVEYGFAGGDVSRLGQKGLHVAVFLLELGGKLGVRAVARHDGDDVAEDAAAVEDEVADHVHGLVAGQFVVEAEGFFAEDLVAFEDDGVFDAAAFDEAFFDEGGDVFVEAEGAGGGKFGFVGFRRDDCVKVLGEAAFRADAGDGDAEVFRGKDGEDGAAFGFDGDRLADLPDAARSILFDDAGRFDEFDVGA